MLLENKTALITGCNKGIGKHTLELFSKNNAKLIACVRKNNKEFSKFVTDLEKKYKSDIQIFELDFEKSENIKKVSDKIIEKNQVNILVNNLGYLENSLFQMTSIQNLKKHFNINLFSQFEFTQYILKSMIKTKNGSIIFLSSSAAIDGNIGRSSYSSSKSSIIALSKVLSRELGRHKIRVNTIAPGLTNTEMMRNTTNNDVLKKIISQLSLGRIADPSEIANVTLFLASDLSSYITGQVIRVDGGM